MIPGNGTDHEDYDNLLARSDRRTSPFGGLLSKLKWWSLSLYVCLCGACVCVCGVYVCVCVGVATLSPIPSR